MDSAGRPVVGEDLSIPGHPEVQVIGDLASLPWHLPPVPGIAPAAKQMGRHAARNVIALIKKEKTRPFRYMDVGMLATIGRNSAVAVLGRLHLSGYPAWLLWLVAHSYFLIGFRNRIVVLIDWAVAYWTFDRNARIVVQGRKEA